LPSTIMGAILYLVDLKASRAHSRAKQREFAPKQVNGTRGPVNGFRSRLTSLTGLAKQRC
jgi:hypothetical protein